MSDETSIELNDASYAATKVSYEISMLRWQDEIEYAETLRERRKLYTTLLILIVGLGVFRIELYGDPSDLRVVPGWTVWCVKACIILAMPCLFLSVRKLFKGGSVKKSSDYTKTRASEFIDLSQDEVEALHQGEIHPESALMLKTLRIREATEHLAAANRAVSENLKAGAFRLFLSCLLLMTAVLLYTISPRATITENHSRLMPVERSADEKENQDNSNRPTHQGGHGIEGHGCPSSRSQSGTPETSNEQADDTRRSSDRP